MENKIYPKPSKIRRFFAFFTDYLISYYLLSLIPIAGIYIAVIYFLFRDSIGWAGKDHGSLGKRLLKLKVIKLKNTGEPPVFLSFRRNWIISIPLMLALVPKIGIELSVFYGAFIYFTESLMVIFNIDSRRFGDYMAKTQVIDFELD